MSDAKFEDAGEAPLRLSAQSEEDLSVIAALLQDAVFPASEMKYDPTRRRFALLVNRFRWEGEALAKADARSYERVQSVLAINDVTAMATQGIDRLDQALVLSLLDLGFAETGDGTGELTFTLAGDGAIRAKVECLDIVLHDVTRPYVAPSGKMPTHPD